MQYHHPSPSLNRSVTFHYGTGITFGVLASLLILFYFFSKVVPKVGQLETIDTCFIIKNKCCRGVASHSILVWLKSFKLEKSNYWCSHAYTFHYIYSYLETKVLHALLYALLHITYADMLVICTQCTSWESVVRLCNYSSVPRICVGGIPPDPYILYVLLYKLFVTFSLYQTW